MLMVLAPHSGEGLRGIGLDPKTLYPPALPIGSARIRSISSDSKLQKSIGKESTIAANGVAPTAPMTEEDRDMKDALAPIYDQLDLAWWWWILEILPLRQHYQRGDDTWATYFGMNMGQGRFIPKQKTNGIRVHRSVKTRLEAETENGAKYKPKAAFDLERTTWVD